MDSSFAYPESSNITATKKTDENLMTNEFSFSKENFTNQPTFYRNIEYPDDDDVNHCLEKSGKYLKSVRELNLKKELNHADPSIKEDFVSKLSDFINGLKEKRKEINSLDVKLQLKKRAFGQVLHCADNLIEKLEVSKETAKHTIECLKTTNKRITVTRNELTVHKSETLNQVIGIINKILACKVDMAYHGLNPVDCSKPGQSKESLYAECTEKLNFAESWFMFHSVQNNLEQIKDKENLIISAINTRLEEKNQLNARKNSLDNIIQSKLDTIKSLTTEIKDIEAKDNEDQDYYSNEIQQLIADYQVQFKLFSDLDRKIKEMEMGLQNKEKLIKMKEEVDRRRIELSQRYDIIEESDLIITFEINELIQKEEEAERQFKTRESNHLEYINEEELIANEKEKRYNDAQLTLNNVKAQYELIQAKLDSSQQQLKKITNELDKCKQDKRNHRQERRKKRKFLEQLKLDFTRLEIAHFLNSNMKSI